MYHNNGQKGKQKPHCLQAYRLTVKMDTGMDTTGQLFDTLNDIVVNDDSIEKVKPKVSKQQKSKKGDKANEAKKSKEKVKGDRKKVKAAFDNLILKNDSYTLQELRKHLTNAWKRVHSYDEDGNVVTNTKKATKNPYLIFMSANLAQVRENYPDLTYKEQRAIVTQMYHEQKASNKSDETYELIDPSSKPTRQKRRRAAAKAKIVQETQEEVEAEAEAEADEE